MTSNAKTSRLSMGLTALVLGVGLAWPAAAADPVLPDWSAIFGADGSLLDQLDASGLPNANGVPDYQDLYDGVDAVFIDDNISDDLVTDMSVRSGAEDLADDTVSNGTVSAPHDLGNAFILAIRDSAGDLELYAGAELLAPVEESPPPATYVEFEFNQNVVQVHGGVPWPIYGDRSDGDLLVRMSFTEGMLSTVEFKRWQAETGYQIVDTVVIPAENTEPCHGAATAYVFCTGEPPLAPPAGGYEVWDLTGNPVDSIPPDGFVEVGVDVAGLLGASSDFTSILIRTPQDIALGSFRALGHWATVSAPSEGG